MVKSAGADTWHKAEQGITLKVGDTIKTGAASSAEITFFDGSTIEIQPYTEIAVSEMNISDTGSTTIRLSQNLGKTVSRVKKLVDPASRYDIETPVGIAAVRGSTMIVTVEGSGRTTVGNLEGDIRVIVNGIEYIIHQGMQRTIIPGHAPGPEVPIGYEPGGGGGGGGGGGTTTPVLQAKLDTMMLAEPATVRVGDDISYTYYLTNTGDFSFHDITVTNNVSGTANYESGNVNGNSTLDPGETWVFISLYTVLEGDPSPLVAAATITALTPTSVTLMATETASTTILPKITVSITNPENVITIYNRTIEVTGTVNDTSITEGTISINGESHAIAISSGSFSTSENVNNGENLIIVTVADGQGHVAIDTITIYVETDIYGMRIELTWDTNGTDMNSHFIRPGGTYGDTESDCYYLNKNPDWGVFEESTDNPSLDQDDDNGYGPENITLQQPYDEGNYEYMVHYYSDNGRGPAMAKVRIWINDTKVAEMSKPMENDEIWHCAIIGWPSGTVNGVEPGIAIEKSADPLTVHAGDNIHYTYAVTNTGNVPLANIELLDDCLENITFTGGDDNADNMLDTEETWLFSADYVPGIEDPDLLENIADVSGTDSLERTVTASDNVTVAILKPGITIDKTAVPLTVHLGDNIDYNYTVTNTGNTPLADITVTDDLLGIVPYLSGDTNENSLLDLDETWVFAASHIASIEDPEWLVNNAAACGTDSLGLTVTASDNAGVTIIMSGIDVNNEADVSEVHPGDNITYTYTVTNTGNIILKDILLTDSFGGDIVFVSGDDNEDDLLDVEETWIFITSHTAGAGDPSPLENTANVSGVDTMELMVTDSGTASVMILNPGIALSKTADPLKVHDGDTVTYSYNVTNNGNAPLSDITVTDDCLGAIPYISGDVNEDNLLDVEETWVFSAGYTVSIEDATPLENTANVSGTDSLGWIVTAADNAGIEILRPGICVDKTANRSYAHVGDNITYKYKITNTGDVPLADITVTDDRLGNIPYICGDTDHDNMLDVNETWYFSIVYMVGGSDPSPLTNIATVCGKDELLQTVTATDSVSVIIYP